MFNVNEAIRHIKRCFVQPWPGCVNVEITHQTSKQGTFRVEETLQLRYAEQLEEFNQAAINTLISNGRNLFFTCGFMDPTGKRKQANVLGVSHIWADRDDINKEQAIAIMEGCPLKPTGYVRSGGGYHFYWVLDSFYDASDPNIHKALNKVKGWVQGDDVTNINRIFRLPGSMCNKPWKYPEPMPCYTEGWDESIRYRLEEVANASISLMDIRLSEEFKYKYIEQAETIGDGTRSETDWAVMKELVRAKHTKDECWEIFTNPRWNISSRMLELMGQGTERARDYFNLTYQKALAYAKEEGSGVIHSTEEGNTCVIKTKIAKNGMAEEEIISNFVIEPIELVEIPEDNETLLTIDIRCRGMVKRVQATGKILIGIKSFLSGVNFPGISWSGSDSDFMEYLMFVRTLVPSDKIFTGTKIVGWYGKGIVTREKVIHKDNIRFVESGEAPIVKFSNPKSKRFTDWMKELGDALDAVAPPHISYLTFGWFASALFAPQIRRKFQDQFPILCLSGRPGSGKTTLARVFTRNLCGVLSEYSAAGTSASLRRTLASTNCFPVFIDEYEASRQHQDIDSYLRFVWQCGGASYMDTTRGKVAFGSLIAPTCITTAHGILDEALRQRLLFLRIRVEERPNNSEDGKNWLQSQREGYFSANWMQERPKQFLPFIKQAYELHRKWQPKNNDRQVICAAIPTGIVLYCDDKYWKRGFTEQQLKSWLIPDEPDMIDEQESPDFLFDLLLAQMISQPMISSMQRKHQWELKGKELHVHSFTFFANAPKVARDLQLPIFINDRWLRDYTKDGMVSKKILKLNSTSKIGGRAMSCIVVDVEKYPQTKGEVMLKNE